MPKSESSNHCPTDALIAFVRDSESPNDESGVFEADQQELFEHLEHCDSCQKLLETSAASQVDWEEVQTALNAAPVEPSGNRNRTATVLFREEGDRSHQSGSELSQATLGDVSVGVAKATAQTKDGAWRLLLHALAPTDDPAAAGRIGSFEILGVIGTGGMGIVLKAREPALDRIVAIKILSPHLASSRSARKRFAREARAAAAVIHDNVIQIYQVSQWNDLPYLVMPYLPDPSLAQRIEQDGALSTEAALSIGMQVARGLSAAHSQGLVHRDVKPANVLLSKGTERAVITDFGLARTADDASLTRAGILAGTPHYMSPEQAKGEKVDSRSDLFSLGSLMYAMLTGAPPVNEELGSRAIERLARHDFPDLPSVGNPPWLIRLVSWLHAKKPADRPDSATRIADVMEQALAHLRQPSKTSLPFELDTPRHSRRSIATWFGGVGLIAASFAIVAFAIPNSTRMPWQSKDPQNSNPLDIRQNDSDTPSESEYTTTPPISDYVDPVILNWDYTESQLETIDMELDELEGSVHR